MSDEQTTSVVSKEEDSTNQETMSLEEKVGIAKTFDREMKDYAKATVKEFLGIYGYEEEDINIDDSETCKTSEASDDVNKQQDISANSPSGPTMVTSASEFEQHKHNDHPVSSVSISSSTPNEETENDNAHTNRLRIHEDLPCPDPGLSSFSWDEYIAQNGGILAPWTCFKQASAPPFNGFQCGMKLEVLDPRSDEGAICVATVVGVIGSRLRLRFDGCSGVYDIWKVIDSSDIHPIGWCEGNGGILKPPVGFHLQGSSFKIFLQKTLANGELAPLRLFKKEPSTPKVNLFCPTFKLEAVDPSNPSNICVASVRNVVADDVYLEFDGHQGRVYKYPFYSRDIFPPGWCYFSGHPLHSPQGYKTSSLIKLQEKSLLPTFRPLEQPAKTQEDLVNMHHDRTQPTVETADSASDDLHPSYTIPGEIELHVNYNCECGSYLDPMKVAELRPVYRGNVRDVLQGSIQAIVNAAYDPRVVIGFLRPGRGKIIIKAKHDEETYTCCLQSVDHMWVMWNMIGRFTDNLRCCKNLFSGNKLQSICPKCHDEGKKSRDKEAKRLAEQERVQKEMRIEELRNEAMRLERQPLQQQQSYQHLVMSQIKRRKIADDDTQEDVESTSSPLTWSINEVVEYFEKSDISKYAGHFREHEIDGGALMLLNRETIMSCMKFKLGPSLKLLNHIAQLKKKFGISSIK